MYSCLNIEMKCIKSFDNPACRFIILTRSYNLTKTTTQQKKIPSIYSFYQLILPNPSLISQNILFLCKSKAITVPSQLCMQGLNCPRHHYPNNHNVITIDWNLSISPNLILADATLFTGIFFFPLHIPCTTFLELQSLSGINLN